MFKRSGDQHFVIKQAIDFEGFQKEKKERKIEGKLNRKALSLTGKQEENKKKRTFNVSKK